MTGRTVNAACRDAPLGNQSRQQWIVDERVACALQDLDGIIAGALALLCELHLPGWDLEQGRRVVAKVEWHPGELYPRVGFIVTNLSRPAERVVAF